MDSIKTMVYIIMKNCCMAIIYLKDAYYSVRISKDFKKFLKSQWKRNYCFTCFPNGLASCPRKFTKSNKVPVICCILKIYP